MKKVLSKVDWIQVGVLGLGLVASLAKSIYETKRFDADLDKKYEDNFEKRVSEIVDQKLKKIK